MPKYIAFLRAINVGGHVVKMDSLRKLFLEAGFENVETFIASGNVIFDSKSRSTEKLERQIETHLHAALGYPVATFIRSKTELCTIAQYQPFSAAEMEVDTNQLYVAFLSKIPGKAATETLMARRSAVDDFHINGRELYWLYRRAMGETLFQGPPLEKSLGVQTTVRNVNTVRRLAAKFSAK